MKKFLLYLCLLCLVSACQKKNETVIERDESPIAAQTATHKPQRDENTDAIPAAQTPPLVPVKTDAWIALEPEAAESKILEAFGEKTEEETLRTLRDRAQMGDDEAKEDFVRRVMARSQTDAHYAEALRMILTIRQFRDPKLLIKRIAIEYAKDQTFHEDWLEQLLTMGNDEDLIFFAQQIAPSAKPRVMTQLQQRHVLSPNDSEAFYQWGTILERMGDANEGRTFIEKAADMGHLDAQYRRAVFLMERDETWAAGLTLLETLSQNQDASHTGLLATLYAADIFCDSVDEAASMFGIVLTDVAFKTLKTRMNAFSDPLLALLNALDDIDTPSEDLCGLSLALALMDNVSWDSTLSRSQFLTCLNKLIDQKPSRNRCDRIYDMASLREFDDFTPENVFDSRERQKIGETMIRCYERAFQAGLSFAEDTPFMGYSTAFQLASLYAGNDLFRIEENPDKALAYITYAAYHDDVTGQFALAKLYETGTYMPKNFYRACYWYQRIDASHLCATMCRDDAQNATCMSCRDAHEMLVQCRKF